MQKYSLCEYVNSQENISLIHMYHDMNCDTHVHEFVELIFIAEGTCEHWIDGEKYVAEKGDLIFVNYGQTHAFHALTKEYQYYNILYVPQFFSEELITSENIYDIFEIPLFREFNNLPISSTQLVRFRENEYLEIKKIVEEMEKEFSEKKIGYRSILNGYSRILFSKILRRIKNSDSDIELKTYIDRITSECLDYINEKCFGKITLQEIAEHTFYNPAYFSRIFKEQVGVNLTDYIKKKRIGEAARLLCDSDLKIEEIMQRVGYTDKNHFYKNFKEIYDMTPASYRKKVTIQQPLFREGFRKKIPSFARIWKVLNRYEKRIPK